MTQPAFRRGGDEAQEEAKRQQGARFSRTNFLSIEDGEQAVLRYLTEKPDWIYVDQHASVPTKPKPADYDGKWPESMPAVCRHDKAFASMYEDCYICDQMKDVTNQWGRPVSGKGIRIWALAVLREEVIGSPETTDDPEMYGKRLGFRDKTREVAEVDDEGKPTDKTKEERALVVVNMAPSNYFNGLSATGSVYGTVRDRDYFVKRSGKGNDTAYTHIPLDKTESLQPGTEKWQRYEEAIAEQKLDLVQIVADRASDEYYARFFDRTKTAPASGSKSANAAAQPAAPAQAPASDVDEDRLAAMRERVRGVRASTSAEVD